ncbi:MAG: HTH domain-containing protein [Verrucomicrobiota bacterium JB024]|nr:HTH domain-containing protein [Verrucomicrobiota bacterium JB024]
MAKDLPWKKAIEKVLRENGGAMHYKDIASQIVSQKLRTSVGATPSATVSANITYSIKQQQEKSPFRRVSPGTFILNDPLASSSPKQSSRIPGSNDATTEEQYTIISSFGMFWQRDIVEWNSKAKLLGMQEIGAEPVDFHDQLGIYLLYDGREVIYVGRATARPIGKRLHEHTYDRLATRWDRFSWFGLKPVSDDGKLRPLPVTIDSNAIVPALEAILIEALEPRQNRKRGDDLAAVEFLQKEDPAIVKKKTQALLENALRKLS